jgi:hypothetical protein
MLLKVYAKRKDFSRFYDTSLAAAAGGGELCGSRARSLGNQLCTLMLTAAVLPSTSTWYCCTSIDSRRRQRQYFSYY